MDLLLLWQWSSAVQLSSLLLIAVFFAALSRSVRGREFRWWIAAWTCNFFALAVTLFYWYVQPSREWLPLIRALYMTSKLAFVLFLLQGAWTLRKPCTQFLRPAALFLGLAAYSVATVTLVTGIDHVGIVQHVALSLFLWTGAAFLLAPPVSAGVGWLAVGLVIRALLSAVEALAYASQILDDFTWTTEAAWFLSAHSAFDSGAEWLITLGCVLALSERTQNELRRANQELVATQSHLRDLADRDPLTELANRRSLPEIFSTVQSQGAILLFFDIDNFKEVNDLYGHQAGDRSLENFGAALKESFRPDDAVVRYAGDEFLVVAQGLNQAAVDERVERVRAHLDARQPARMPLSFSVGVAELPAGGDPERALRDADASMYEAKARTYGEGEVDAPARV